MGRADGKAHTVGGKNCRHRDQFRRRALRVRQVDTLRNLLLAWVLTLPVCVLLGAGIFAFGINLLLGLGIK